MSNVVHVDTQAWLQRRIAKHGEAQHIDFATRRRFEIRRVEQQLFFAEHFPIDNGAADGSLAAMYRQQPNAFGANLGMLGLHESDLCFAVDSVSTGSKLYPDLSAILSEINQCIANNLPYISRVTAKELAEQLRNTSVGMRHNQAVVQLNEAIEYWENQLIPVSIELLEESAQAADVLQHLPAHHACQIQHYLDNPTPFTWDAIYTLRIALHVTCWEAWRLVDLDAPRSVDQSHWSALPEPETLLLGIRAAIERANLTVTRRIENLRLELSDVLQQSGNAR